MSDLIKREDVLRLAESGKLLSGSFGERAKDIISSIPTAEPKVGRWIEKAGMWCDDPTFRCSVCGEEYELLEGTPIDNGMNYCPNCGSRMFERSNNE